jgi:RimJ/RimL family protein N-acetyltransferase
MTLEIVKLDAGQWDDICSSTLKYSFGYEWPKGKTRADFAIIVQDKTTQTPYGYASIIELDSESVFLEHGGNFKSTISTSFTFRGYSMIIDYLKEKYRNLSTRILNTNTAMLKMALKAGFIVTGVYRDHLGDLFVNLDINRVGE